MHAGDILDILSRLSVYAISEIGGLDPAMALADGVYLRRKPGGVGPDSSQPEAFTFVAEMSLGFCYALAEAGVSRHMTGGRGASDLKGLFRPAARSS